MMDLIDRRGLGRRGAGPRRRDTAGPRTRLLPSGGSSDSLPFVRLCPARWDGVESLPENETEVA